MSDTQHTPTPWYFGKSTDSDGNVMVALLSDLVIDGKPLRGEVGEGIRGEIVLCSIGGKLSCNAPNASFLERAVNCHDELVAIAKRASAYRPGPGSPLGNAARAILAKAKVQT